MKDCMCVRERERKKERKIERERERERERIEFTAFLNFVCNRIHLSMRSLKLLFSRPSFFILSTFLFADLFLLHLSLIF